jgi:hypothetical protein
MDAWQLGCILTATAITPKDAEVDYMSQVFCSYFTALVLYSHHTRLILHSCAYCMHTVPMRILYAYCTHTHTAFILTLYSYSYCTRTHTIHVLTLYSYCTHTACPSATLHTQCQCQQRQCVVQVTRTISHRVSTAVRLHWTICGRYSVHSIYSYCTHTVLMRALDNMRQV